MAGSGSAASKVRHGRTIYGSGRKLAQDAQLKLTVDKRAGDRTFADYSKAGKANFGDAAEAFIMRLPVKLTARVAELAGQVASLRECSCNGGTAPAGAGLSPFLPWTPQGRARRRPASDAGRGP